MTKTQRGAKNQEKHSEQAKPGAFNQKISKQTKGDREEGLFLCILRRDPMVESLVVFTEADALETMRTVQTGVHGIQAPRISLLNIMRNWLVLFYLQAGWPAVPDVPPCSWCTLARKMKV